MRVMVIVRANEETETGALPKQENLDSMSHFNEELVKAGIMLAGDGLQPSAKGKRVRYSRERQIVTDGPFAETKELIAGFWLWKVKSMEEAVAWVKRAPFDPGMEVEIRPLYEMEDFGAELSEETREREERLRAEIAAPK